MFCVSASVKEKGSTDRENRMKERAKKREAAEEPPKKRGRSPQPKQAAKRGPSSGKSKVSNKVEKPGAKMRSSSRKVVDNVKHDRGGPKPKNRFP